VENLELWDSLKIVPKWALKTIAAGRLKGKSDIKPQWKYMALTEKFGPCGIGWKYTIDKQWIETGANGEVFAFTNISLFIKVEGKWSEAIPATGGSKLVQKEKDYLYNNDEAFKMSDTDALGTACKMVGVAASVFLGQWDGTKYTDLPQEDKPISKEQLEQIEKLVAEKSANVPAMLDYLNTGVTKLELLPANQFDKVLEGLKAKKAPVKEPEVPLKEKLTNEINEYLKAHNAEKPEHFRAVLIEITQFEKKDKDGAPTGDMDFIEDINDKRFYGAWMRTAIGRLRAKIKEENK